MRFIFILFINFVLHYNALGQQHNHSYHLAITSNFLLAGELNSSYDFLSGTSLSLVFEKQKKWNKFFALNAQTDIDNPASRFVSIEAIIGLERKLKKGFFLKFGLGPSFYHEQHKLLANEKIVSFTNNSFGFASNFNFGLKLQKKYALAIAINQLQFDATSIGLHLNYKLY